jgi:hypothetical protein
VVVRREPWYEDYVEKNKPLVSFCLEGHQVFVHSGIDRYLRERRSAGYQSTGKTDTCTVFGATFLDSAGVISRVHAMPPLNLFPEMLPAALSMPRPGVVPDSD